MPGRPKSETRCYWFEDDGTPLKKSGCPNGYLCDFTHPADDSWDRLPIQFNRPPGYDRRSHERSSGRRSSYSRWESPRPRSRYRSSSRSRSPSYRTRPMVVDSRPTRRDSNASSSASELSKKPTAVRDAPSSPSKMSAPSVIPPSSTPLSKLPPKPPPDGPSALRKKKPIVIVPASTNSPPVLKQQQAVQPAEQVPGLKVQSSSTTVNSSTSSVQVNPAPPAPAPPSLPPPPDTSTPIPPPYPLPNVPEGLTLKIPPPIVEPSPADKRKIWEERIKLFADAYQAKRDLERCEQVYKYASDLAQSNVVATFSQDDKAKFNADLAELVTNRDKAKKEHDDALEKLIDKGSWPLGPPKSDEREEEERRDILRHVQELNDTAQKMSKILGDIAMQTTPPILPLPTDGDDDIYEDDGMDLDDNAPGTSEPPLASRKRQRLSESEDGVARQRHDPNLPTREELEEYRQRLEMLEGKIIDLDNDLIQYEQDIKQSFEDKVENKIEVYDAARKQREKERKEQEKEIKAAEMTKVNTDAEDLGNDVKEVGKEISDAIAKIETLKIQLVEEKKQRDVMQDRLVQVNERLQGYVQQRESNLNKIQTLETALKAYQSSVSRPSPPCTPSDETIAPTSAYILSQLEEPIIQVIREHIQPILTQSRIDTEALVRERNVEIVKKIWPRLELVSRLLTSVADRMDTENIPTNAGPPLPLQAPPPPASAPLPTHPMPPPNVNHQVPAHLIYPIHHLAGQPPWFGPG